MAECTWLRDCIFGISGAWRWVAFLRFASPEEAAGRCSLPGQKMQSVNLLVQVGVGISRSCNDLRETHPSIPWLMRNAGKVGFEIEIGSACIGWRLSLLPRFKVVIPQHRVFTSGARACPEHSRGGSGAKYFKLIPSLLDAGFDLRRCECR